MNIDLSDATARRVMDQFEKSEALHAEFYAAKDQLGRDIAFKALTRHQASMAGTLEALAMIIKAQMPKQEAERIAA